MGIRLSAVGRSTVLEQHSGR